MLLCWGHRMVAEVLDLLILLWLISTWFYEGHHRRCTVIQRCPKCGGEKDTHCASADIKCEIHGDGM